MANLSPTGFGITDRVYEVTAGAALAASQLCNLAGNRSSTQTEQPINIIVTCDEVDKASAQLKIVRAEYDEAQKMLAAADAARKKGNEKVLLAINSFMERFKEYQKGIAACQDLTVEPSNKAKRETRQMNQTMKGFNAFIQHFIALNLMLKCGKPDDNKSNIGDIYSPKIVEHYSSDSIAGDYEAAVKEKQPLDAAFQLAQSRFEAAARQLKEKESELGVMQSQISPPSENSDDEAELLELNQNGLAISTVNLNEKVEKKGA